MLAKAILKYKIFEIAIDTFLEKIIRNFRKNKRFTSKEVSSGNIFNYIETSGGKLYTDCRIVDILEEHLLFGSMYKIVLIDGKLDGKRRHYTIMEEIGKEPYIYFYN